MLLGTGTALSAIIAGCASDDAGDENGSDDEADDAGADDANGDETDTDDDDNGTDDDETGTDDDDGDDDTEDEETGSVIEGLDITEDELVGDDLSSTVSGVLVNNTGEDLESVELHVEFYDADGDQVDESVTSTAELADEEEWAFEVMSVEDDIVDYTIEITNATPSYQSPT
ncbi:FxLYD domain-containing protein [Natronococcus pandeyae]|uniref:FxLYD domain-containing protein n=1 Tax=Natronococcus pandeyae TaxID=2055836 RepID=UPI001F43E573|nr:FxLYD domain-containing protein [Natronococcus pandeyae]